MSVTSTPAPGNSVPISSDAQAAPRRGRPRVHTNDSAKKAAYRQRKFERELRAHRAAATRYLRKNPHQRDFISEAKTAYLEGNQELALSLMEQHEAREEMAAYDQGVAREERRVAKPVKHNRACRKNACLCAQSMSRGLFLTDAPKGHGKMISGGFDSEKAALLNDIHQTAELDGGVVEPSGWGSKRDEKVDYKNRHKETDSTLAEKHFQDASWLKCYVAGCSRLPWGVLAEPNDYDGSTYYCCDLHRPTRVG